MKKLYLVQLILLNAIVVFSQSFQGVLQGVDYTNKMLVLRHKPTCYELAVYVDNKSSFNYVNGESLEFSDVKQGLEFVTFESDSDQRLKSIVFLKERVWNPEFPEGGASGTTVEIIDSEVKRVRNAYDTLKYDILKEAPIMMSVSPELSLVGEQVVYNIEAWSKVKPNTRVTLDMNYFEAGKCKSETREIAWKVVKSDNGFNCYQGSLTFKGLPVGQHVIKWSSNVGGDIKDYWRSFAVTDSSKLVVMLHYTSRTPNKELFENYLPFDHWDENPPAMLGGPFGERVTPTKASDFTKYSREYRMCGATPNVFIIQGNYAGRIGWPAPIPVQFMQEPLDVQKRVLKATLEVGEMARYDTSKFGYAAYEFGTQTVNAAQDLGITTIGSMCIHQNWQDGAWGINHSGRPLRPYFGARDDFRKTSAKSDKPIVLVSQHDKSILWTEYGLGVFEPCWLDQGWVGSGGAGRTVVDDIFMSRHYDILDASIQNVKNQSVPYLQSIGIEFSEHDTTDKVTMQNALMINYAVKRASQGDVVFCNQSAASEFYIRHYKKTPETVFYDTDFWAGTEGRNSVTSTWKPQLYPDLMHIENDSYSAYFKKPEMLSSYRWDYTKEWSYDDFGNREYQRNVMGFFVPGEHDKYLLTPLIEDERDFFVKSWRTQRGDKCVIVIEVDAKRSVKKLPVALWDIECEWRSGRDWWRCSKGARFVPIAAPYSDNLNGIAELDVKQGKSRFTIEINSAQRSIVSQTKKIGNLYFKLFKRDGGEMIYVWCDNPYKSTFTLNISDITAGKFYCASYGEEQSLVKGDNTITIQPESWGRLIGIKFDNLEDSIIK